MKDNQEHDKVLGFTSLTPISRSDLKILTENFEFNHSFIPLTSTCGLL